MSPTKPHSTIYWDDDVKKAVQEHIARKVAQGHSAHGAVSQLVNEAVRMLLIPMDEQKPFAEEEPEGE